MSQIFESWHYLNKAFIILKKIKKYVIVDERLKLKLKIYFTKFFDSVLFLANLIGHEDAKRNNVNKCIRVINSKFKKYINVKSRRESYKLWL